jgi:ribosome-associated protein
MTNKREQVIASHEITNQIAELMLERKAKDIKIIDVRELTSLTDYFIICTSESDPQSKAISSHIDDTLRADGIKPWHIEGYQHLEWILLDYVNLVVHIFSKEAREYYDFERLWADAKITEIQDGNE